MSTALITGASGGIGLELARECARHGWDLAIVARTASTLQAVADELSETHKIRVTPVPLDLADERSPQQLFDRLRSAHIHVDALINNAGFTTYGMFVDVPAAEELEEIRLNVVALTALIKLFLPPMIARRSGRILNVASTAGYQPGPLMAVYYATKAYVLSLSQALAEETRGTGVTVTTLCPGPTETGFRSRGNVPRTKLFRFIAGESKSVAKAGYAGMMRGKRVVIPGAFNAAGAYMARVSPTGIVTRVIRHVNSPQ